MFPEKNAFSIWIGSRLFWAPRFVISRLKKFVRTVRNNRIVQYAFVSYSGATLRRHSQEFYYQIDVSGTSEPHNCLEYVFLGSLVRSSFYSLLDARSARSSFCRCWHMEPSFMHRAQSKHSFLNFWYSVTWLNFPLQENTNSLWEISDLRLEKKFSKKFLNQ